MRLTYALYPRALFDRFYRHYVEGLSILGQQLDVNLSPRRGRGDMAQNVVFRLGNPK